MGGYEDGIFFGAESLHIRVDMKTVYSMVWNHSKGVYAEVVFSGV
jgi:hypothetical protein